MQVAEDRSTMIHYYRDRQRPPHRPTGLWIAGSIVAVVIVVLAAVLIVQHTGDTFDGRAVAASSQPSSPSAQSISCGGYTAAVNAGSPAGWYPTIGRRGLAYAVPPGWAVQACGVQVGWQKRCPNGAPGACAVRAMSAAATLASPVCPKSNIGMAGVAGSKTPDINAALAEEQATVPIIYSSNQGQLPRYSFGPARQFLIGARPAVRTVASLTGIATDACSGSDALHSIVVTTVPNVEGSVVFLISLRAKPSGALDSALIDKIVATLHS